MIKLRALIREFQEMSIEQFIEDNRDELRRAIRRAVPNVGNLDDDDIEQWIMNDEGLYNWAKDSGVEV